MKKAGLLVLFLAISLIFSTTASATASAGYVKIGFSGPYTVEGGYVIVPDMDPIPLELVPSAWVCDWDLINYKVEGDWDPLSPYDPVIEMSAPEIPPESYHYLWHADENLPDMEFGSFDYVLEPGNMNPYYTDVYVYEGEDEWYLHFYGGQGIPEGIYFDIYAIPVDIADFNPSLIAFHPTPIPGAVWLLGSGLIGLVALRRKSS